MSVNRSLAALASFALASAIGRSNGVGGYTARKRSIGIVRQPDLLATSDMLYMS